LYLHPCFERRSSRPRVFLRYSCWSLANWRFGLYLTRYRAQHRTSDNHMEVQRYSSAVASSFFKNRRVSVRARVKLSCPTERLQSLLPSSIATRIRQHTIMCTSSSRWKVSGAWQCQEVARRRTYVPPRGASRSVIEPAGTSAATAQGGKGPFPDGN
jgi:hypothetical protein